jgi:hypothetical protein
MSAPSSLAQAVGLAASPCELACSQGARAVEGGAK